jgi:Mrp family chromosome partitioning ATPase
MLQPSMSTSTSVRNVGLLSFEEAPTVLDDPWPSVTLVLLVASWNALSVSKLNNALTSLSQFCQEAFKSSFGDTNAFLTHPKPCHGTDQYDLRETTAANDDCASEMRHTEPTLGVPSAHASVNTTMQWKPFCNTDGTCDDDFRVQALAIRVDESDETLRCMCDRCDETNPKSSWYSLMHAPLELPALVLCVSSQTHNRRWLPIPIEPNILQSLITHFSDIAMSSSSPLVFRGVQYNDMLLDAIRKALLIIVTQENETITQQERQKTGSSIDDRLRSTRIHSTVITTTRTPSIHPLQKMPHGRQPQTQPLRIFVAGDKTQVGKSTICLGLLGSLLAMNYHPSELAYIKPATQCEATTLIAQFCSYHGIDAVPIGPIVYYQGFTRSYLRGEIDATSMSMLEQVSQISDALAYGYYDPRIKDTHTTNSNHANSTHFIDTTKWKKVLIIDGVGYPAVGSICGTDNADVAHACGYPRDHEDISSSSLTDSNISRVPASVLIVGKSGIGDAIDSYNLNSNYFASKNVPVLGAIFNRLSTDPYNYYNLEQCKASIESYFDQYKQDEKVFGFLPEVQLPDKMNGETMPLIERFIQLFSTNIPVEYILQSAMTVSSSENIDGNVWKKPKLMGSKIPSQHVNAPRTVLTRNEIEFMAKRLGAPSG